MLSCRVELHSTFSHLIRHGSNAIRPYGLCFGSNAIRPYGLCFGSNAILRFVFWVECDSTVCVLGRMLFDPAVCI